jgi:hypothetical protein
VVSLTPAQRDVVAFLIAEALRDPTDLENRWAKAAPSVRRHAEKGQLVLLQNWTQTTVITADGEILVIDTENDAPDRPATAPEQHLGLFRGIRHYPELLSLLPTRPSTSRTCPDCLGTGVHRAILSNPQLRNIICTCGGAGWIAGPEKGALAE